MKRRDMWSLSLLNLLASPVRSALTILGFAIGAAAILAVLTLGEAGKNQVQSELDRLGIDKLWVSGENLQSGDAAFLREKMNLSAAETLYWPAELVLNDASITLNAVGCTQAYLQMTGVQIAQGRMLCPLEWEEDSRCLLLGEQAAAQLKALPGDRVMVNGIPFFLCATVCGTDVFSKVEIESSAYVPLAVMNKMTGGLIHELTVDVPAGSLPNETAQRISVLLDQSGRSVETMTLQAQMDAAQSVVDTFVQVLGWVALVCILVGGVGVMNILLVSVRERRREIGVMKSLGAMQSQICALFLTEAALYAVIGGIFGLLLGSLIIQIAGYSIGLLPIIRFSDALTVFLAAVSIGLIFGVTPAFRAASLRCVEALRQE